MLDQEQAYTEEFRIEKIKDGKKIALQAENIISNKKLIESLRDTISQFGNITNQTKIEIQTVVKEIPVPIKDYVYIKDNFGISYLKTPAAFSYKEPSNWFSMDGVITDKGTIEFKRLEYRNSISVYAGWKKRTLGQTLLFKKKERQIGVVDMNPYSNVTSLKNFTIQEKKNRVSLGLQGGYGITPKGFLPYAGLGLNVRIF